MIFTKGIIGSIFGLENEKWKKVQATKPLKILLINDDEDDTYILHEVAELFIDKITLANLDIQASVSESITSDNLPDIVLLDLYVSKINGVDVLKQIRATKHLKSIPVIIYSGRQHSSIIKKCFELGATLFVEKPHTYKGVERLFKKIMALDWSKYKQNAKEHDFIMHTDDY